MGCIQKRFENKVKLIKRFHSQPKGIRYHMRGEFSSLVRAKVSPTATNKELSALS